LFVNCALEASKYLSGFVIFFETCSRQAKNRVHCDVTGTSLCDTERPKILPSLDFNSQLAVWPYA